MPRFGTRTLLFVFVLAALWFSTFSGYAAGRDVRASVLLVVLLTAGFTAVYGRGKLRAFWAGFFVVMLLCGGNLWHGPANKYVPNFSWRIPQLGNVYNLYSAPPIGSTSPAPPSGYYQPVAPTDSPPPAIYPDPSDTYAPVPVPAIAAPALLPPQGVRDYQFEIAVNASIETLWTLALSCIVGLIGTWLYSSIGQKNHQP